MYKFLALSKAPAALIALGSHIFGSLALRALAIASLVVTAPISQAQSPNQIQNKAQVQLGSVPAGTSATATVTLKIVQPGSLFNINVTTGPSSKLDFTNAGGGTCATGKSYAAGAQCTVQVRFTPTAPGYRYGAVVLTNSDGYTAAITYLQGTGDAPLAYFSVPTTIQHDDGHLAPEAIAIDQASNIMTADGWVYAGNNPDPAYYGYIAENGTSIASGQFFLNPYAIAVDGAGGIYSSSDPGGSYDLGPTLAPGAPATSPFLNGAVDGAGNIFTPCPNSTGLCKETLQSNGVYVESIVASGLSTTRIAVDGAGNVFAIDASDGTVFLYSPTASSYSESVLATGQYTALAVDALGNLYLTSASGKIVKEVAQPDGTYTPVSLLSTSAFSGILASDSLGNLYQFNATGSGPYGLTTYGLFETRFTAPPTIAFSNTPQTLSTGTRTVIVTNNGNSPLQFTHLTFPSNFPQVPGGVTDCTASTSLVPNASCKLTFRFAPNVALNGAKSLSITQHINLVTNTLNLAGTHQSITLTGTETPGPAATPAFSLPGGVYYSNQSVTITDATPGAIVYYTLNGSQPTTSSFKYSGPVSIRAAQTLKAIAAVPGQAASSVASAYYALTVPTPVISPAGGTFTSAQSVTVSDPLSTASIFYTTAGNTPTTSSAHYTSPIPVSSTETIRVFAAQTGYLSSPVVSERFTITAASAK